MNPRLFVLFLIVPCLVLSCTSISAAKYEIENLHPRPSNISVSDEDGATIFKVESEFGIGRAKVILLKGQWPSSSKVRLYLKGLEGMSISTPDREFQRHELSIEKYEVDGLIYFDVILPEVISASTQEIQVHWIDFYR